MVAAVTLLAGANADPQTVGDGRTVLLSDRDGPNTQRTGERILAEIGPAVDAVVAFWGADWQRDIPIDVTATEEQFVAAMAGTGVEASFADVAAVAVATWVDPAHSVAEGQRIVFAARAYEMSDAALRLVLRHELFHFAARAQTALDAPLWVTEGVADFVARPAVPAAAVTTSLPVDADFLGPEPGRSQAYDAAWSFMRFVADTFGAQDLRQFYVRAAGADHIDAPGAAREVFGIEMPDLVAMWGSWQRSET